MSTEQKEMTQEEEAHWNGERYLNNSDLQYQWATSYIPKLGLKGHEKVLDIGCGDGRVTAIIAYAVPHGHVLGVDSSASMMLTAQEFQSTIPLGNLSFSKQDAMELDFKEEFDLVVSFSCLHWVPDHLAVLQGIEKGLKKGGKAFLYFGPDHGRVRFDYATKQVVSLPNWKDYFADFSSPFILVTPSKFAGYAEKVGLLLKRMEIVTVDETFPNREAFIAWMTGWMPYLKFLPEKLHHPFLEEIMDAYLKIHPIDANGNIHYIDYWMEVELLKSH